jgi:hypothetical protein
MTVSISICPTSMEFPDGSRYDEDLLLDAIRAFVNKRHPEARITCLQVGYRQGDEWAKIGGDEEAGNEFMQEFWDSHQCGSEAGDALFSQQESGDA